MAQAVAIVDAKIIGIAHAALVAWGGIGRGTDKSDPAVAVKQVEVAIGVIMVVGGIACVCLAEFPVSLIRFGDNIDDLDGLPIIKAGKFGLVAGFIIDLYFVYGFCRDIFERRVQVPAEVWPAIYQYLLYGLSLGLDPVICGDTGQPL